MKGGEGKGDREGEEWIRKKKRGGRDKWEGKGGEGGEGWEGKFRGKGDGKGKG